MMWIKLFHTFMHFVPQLTQEHRKHTVAFTSTWNSVSFLNFNVNGLTVLRYHSGTHLQTQTAPAQPPSCGPAAGSAVAGLQSEPELTQLNSAPPLAMLPGTTQTNNFSNTNFPHTNHHLFSSIASIVCSWASPVAESSQVATRYLLLPRCPVGGCLHSENCREICGYCKNKNLLMAKNTLK